MKKNIIFILLLLFAVNSVFCQSTRPIAAVKNTTGIVKLQKASNGKLGMVKIGTLLFNGDRLFTEKFGMVAILFIDGSLLKVKELSDVTLNTTAIGEGKIDTKVDLPLGEVWTKVTRRESKFEIHTPSSVASVKGTEFAVNVDQSGNSSLMVFQGNVEFRNDMGSVLVKQNRTSSAKVGEPPLEPVKMSTQQKKSDKSFDIPKESKWNLKIDLKESQQAAGTPFGVEVSALDSASQMLDSKCTTDIAISSDNPKVLFSLDNKNWSEEINTTLNKGKLKYFAKYSLEGDITLSVFGSQCSSVKVSVSVYKSEDQKNREKAKILKILKDAGVEGLDELEYTGSSLRVDFDLENILDRIISGDLVIDKYDVDEDKAGEKKIAVKIKPAEE